MGPEEPSPASVPGVPRLHRGVRPALARVLRRRCPQCGEGALFRAYGRPARACARCGLVYRREQGAQTGSMYVTAAVTQVFAALVVAAVWIFTDWGVVLSTSVAIPVVGAFCYAFLPVAQAAWIGVEYATDVANRESWVRPRP